MPRERKKSTSTVERIFHDHLCRTLNDDQIQCEADTRVFKALLLESIDIVRLLKFLEKNFDLHTLVSK